MTEKEHELNRWLRRNRTTKTKMASDIDVSTSTITKHTKGGRVSDKMLLKYTNYGVPKLIVNMMRKQGV